MGKGFGDLFGESWNEMFSKFVPYLKVFLLLNFLPMLIFLIISFILVIVNGGFTGLTFSDFGAFSLTGFATSGLQSSFSSFHLLFLFILIPLIIVVAILNYIGTLSYFYISFSKKKDILFKEAFRGGMKYFWSFLGLSVVLLLALAGLFLLLIIPGIIFIIFWLFSPYVLFNENRGIIDSMKKSKQIVKGKWWRVFGNLLLLGLIIGGVSLIAGLIPIIGSLAVNFFSSIFMMLYFKNFYLELKKNSARKD